MKIQGTGTFIKGLANVGTVTFTGSNIPTVQENILAIVNVTRGVIIYSPADSLKGGVYTDPTLTLEFDTDAMSNSDSLLIYLEDGLEYNRVYLENPTTSPETGLTKEETQLLVLDRLNSLKIYTDGIEALLTAINSDTTTENTNLASVIAALDLIKGYVDNLESYTDGLEGLVGSSNTLLTTLSGYVDGLETLLATLNGKDFSTSAKQDLLFAELLLKAKLTDTQPVIVSAIAINKKSVEITTSGDTTILTPAVGKKIRLLGFGYSASGTVDAGNCKTQWRFGTNAILDTQYLTGNQAYGKTPGNGKFCYDGAVNESLIVTLSISANIAVNIDYQEI